MTEVNTAIEVSICIAFGLFVGAFGYVVMRTFNMFSPATETRVDSRPGFDVPRTVELNAESRLHVHGSCAGNGADIERDQGEGGVPVIASACEAKIRLMTCGDVCEANPAHAAYDLVFHDPVMSDESTTGEVR